MPEIDRYDDLPKPAYEVVTETNDDERDVYLIKVANPRPVRVIDPKNPGQFVKPDYVKVVAASVSRDVPGLGQFTYQETSVTASDEDGKDYPAYLYFTQRRLALHEVMFAIGEI